MLNLLNLLNFILLCLMFITKTPSQRNVFSLRLLDRTDILSVLSTFTTVRRRILSEKKKTCLSLKMLARDSVVLGLLDSNPEERLVAPLVARLETQLGLEKKEGKPGPLQTLLA